MFDENQIDSKSTNSYKYTVGHLRGIVTNSIGEPIIGAQIIIKTLEMGTLADRAGYYSFPRIPIGTYDITVVFINYNEHIERDVEIKRDDTFNLDFILKESNP